MKKIAITGAAFAVLVPTALASSGASIKVSPKNVNAGNQVRVSGAVGHGCQVGHKGDVATIYSKAFSTKHTYAGVPSVNASLSSSGTFSVKVWTTKTAGSYTVSGRCGGGKFGATTLNVLIGSY